MKLEKQENPEQQSLGEWLKSFDPYRNLYILGEDRQPIKFRDSGWCSYDDWMQANLHLKFVSVSLRGGWFHQSKISTVFLGWDHSFGEVPILFETMVFGGPMDQHMWGYHTWEEAEQDHKNICILVEASYRTSNYLKWLLITKPKDYARSAYYRIKWRAEELWQKTNQRFKSITERMRRDTE